MDTGTAMDTVTDMGMRKNSFLAPCPLTVAFALILPWPAIAQQTVTGAMPTPGVGMPATINTAQDDAADQGSGKRAWAISPRIGASLTSTNHPNVGGSVGNQNTLITEISPGIHIQAQTVRLQGYLDYSLNGQFYSRGNGSRNRNALNAFATLEAIDNWLFVDVSGNIAQQTISAFGPQSPSGASVNSNSTETSTYRVSPYIRGTIGHVADYMVRYNVSTTRADSALASNVDVSQWIGQLRGDTPFHNLRWTLDASRQSADYANGRKTDADLSRLLLTYLITPQFSLSASTGWERNDYASPDQESKTTYGYGFDWNPTPRTQISAFRERRFFGNGHRLNISHRFPNSSIRYTDSRDVSVLPNQFGSVGLGSMYDMVFNMLANANPGADPIDLANITNQFLQSTGIDPNQQIVSGFLSSRASEQRQQQLAFILRGTRNTLTVQYNRSKNSTFAATQFNLLDDFSQSSSILQKGFSVTFSHRLSAVSNLNLLASQQKSTGNYIGTGNLDATTTLYQLSLTTQLGAKTNGSLSVRHTKYDSNTNPYTENALIASLLYRY